MLALSPASLLFKCWGRSGSKAHSISSFSSALLEHSLTMSAIRGPSAGGAGGVGMPEKRKPGHSKGSGKKAVEMTVAAPSSASHRGRPSVSENKKTLAALAAIASGSIGPNAAASSLAGGFS
jgi:hypothetical protein